MKNFFSTLIKSLYNPEFYQGIPENRTGDAVKYFLGFIFVVAVLFSIMPMVIGLGFFLAAHNEADQGYAQVRGFYPSDLVVKINQGEISINQPEPYLIPTPSSWVNGLSDGGRRSSGFRIENLIVFDTAKPIASEDFEADQTLVIVGKNEIGMYDPNKSKVEIYDLKNLGLHENITIDQSMYTGFLDQAWKVLRGVAIFCIVLLPVFLFFGFGIGYAAYLLFGVLFIWLAFHICNRPYTYGQSYKTGLYLLTLPIILNFLFPVVFIIPFSFTLLLAILTWLNFKDPVQGVLVPLASTPPVAPSPIQPTPDATPVVDPFHHVTALPAEGGLEPAPQTRDAVIVEENKLQ